MAKGLSPLPRPWHGASDREEDARVIALRLQRAEVDALLAFRGAESDSDEAARLWRRLAALREQRRGLLTPEESAGLPSLPPPPSGALTRWQAFRLRLGLLRLDSVIPAAKRGARAATGRVEPRRGSADRT